jgi:hypothetical protein
LHLGWSRDVEEVERAGEGLVGDVVEANGDADVAVVAEGVDREVAQGGRALRAAADADLRVVLAEGAAARIRQRRQPIRQTSAARELTHGCGAAGGRLVAHRNSG